MTRKVGYPLSGASYAKGGGADSDVVDVGSALHPTAVHALSFSSMYVSLQTALGGGDVSLTTALGGGGGWAEGREWGGGGRAQAGWGGGSERDE